MKGKIKKLIDGFAKEKFIQEIHTKCPHCNKYFTITLPVDSIAIAESINELKEFIKSVISTAKKEYPYGFSASISWKQKDEWFEEWFGKEGEKR